MDETVAFPDYLELMDVKRSISTDNAIGQALTWWKSFNLVGKILTFIIVAIVIGLIVLAARLALKFTTGI